MYDEGLWEFMIDDTLDFMRAIERAGGNVWMGFVGIFGMVCRIKVMRGRGLRVCIVCVSICICKNWDLKWVYEFNVFGIFHMSTSCQCLDGMSISLYYTSQP